MARSAVTYAGHVKPGDRLVEGDDTFTITKIRRAQGRKPPSGENLHLIDSEDQVHKRNSEDPVRIIPDGHGR